MGVSDYYFSALPPLEQTAYKTLTAALLRGGESVRLPPACSHDAVARILRAVKYEHPELFHVDFRSVHCVHTPSSMIVHPRYRSGSASVSVTREHVRLAMERILSLAKRESLRSDYEKCRWVHNYLVKNVQYQTEAAGQPDQFPEAFHIDGVFLRRSAVCEGIAKAFQILCGRLGLSVMTVHGTMSSPQSGQDGPHSWNIVELAGCPVHIDVTGDNGVSFSSRHTRYDYFCIPDAWIKRDHAFSDSPPCVTDVYSYFARRQVCFSSSRPCKAYLEEAMRKKERILYFKFAGEHLPQDIAFRVDSLVNRGMRRFCTGMWKIESVPNPNQLCFFYRIL